MRYRAFGRSGLVVSAVSVLLDAGARRSARDWRGLIEAAMNLGINGFEIAGDAPAMIEGAAEALSGVERELLFISWRPRALAADPGDTVEAFLARTNLGYLDLLSFDEQAPAAQALERLRETGLARAFGLTSDDEETDLLIAHGAFEALTTCYSPISGWRERNRLKAAARRDMAVIARNIWPEEMHPRKALLKRSLFANRRNPLAGMGGYGFLENTPGWTAEEICLAYVLTEPAVTTVRLEVDRIDRMAKLAEVTDKDLPTGVAAQIEMARFSDGAPKAAAARA